jgi:hypothetical protein
MRGAGYKTNEHHDLQIYYYLCDDTVEVVEKLPANSGCDKTGSHRARSHSRSAHPLILCIPYSLAYSVPLFLNRQCDRTLDVIVDQYVGLDRIVASEIEVPNILANMV